MDVSRLISHNIRTRNINGNGSGEAVCGRMREDYEEGSSLPHLRRGRLWVIIDNERSAEERE